DADVDPPRQRSARCPTASVPSRCRARCGAWPAPGECDERASRLGSPTHRSHGPRPHSLADTAGVHGLLAAAEWHPPAAAPLANRCGSPRSASRPVACLPGQPPGQVLSSRVTNKVTLASALAAIGGIATCLQAAVHRADQATVYDRSRPIDLTAAREPIQQREMNQIPNARELPVPQ